jgi:hypothetical protein
MKKILVNLLFALTITFCSIALSQCPSGTLGVTGAGCGCISGCDLTSFGGPNCGGGTSGNCSAGEVPFSATISVPAGCTYTVTAVMQNRSTTCNASGVDAGDGLKVDVQGGSKPFQTGAGNASVSDSYTLTGPGTIEVSGLANRADEIATYTTTYSGATCVNCMSVLPVGSTNFSVQAENNNVACSWITESEHNNHYFTIEKSLDGVNFEEIGNLLGKKESFTPTHYKLYDSSPNYDVISYYRLSQTDLDGKHRILDVKSIFLIRTEELEVFPNPSTGKFQVSTTEQVEMMQLVDNTGRQIPFTYQTETHELHVEGSVGNYMLYYLENKTIKVKHLIILR